MRVVTRWVGMLAMLLAICSQSVVNARDVPERVLVLTAQEGDEERYSQVLAEVKALNLEVDVKLASDSTASLTSNGLLAYQGLILLAPNAKSLGKDITPEIMIKMLEKGMDILLVADSVHSELTKKIALEMGVEIDSKKAMVVDHGKFQKELDDGQHTTILAEGHAVNKPLTGGKTFDGISFHGVGAALVTDNELVEKLLWSSPTSFTYKPKDVVSTRPLATGTDTVLAAALQTRAGSRAVYAGSTFMFQNDILEKAGSGHSEFARRLVGWTFASSGYISAGNLRHHRVNETEEQSTYRVKDDLVVQVDMFEWRRAEKLWAPFTEDDVQIEFTSMNPYVRARMTPLGNGTLQAFIPVPDNIGIYKFTIDYYRPGYTPVIMSKTLSIRPFMHNEFPRFIFSATPYYVVCLLNVVGVILFGLVFLYSKEPKKTSKQTKAE